MSSVNKLSVLAFASTVLATPFVGQHHGHQHAHRGLHSYGAPFPYPGANTTSVWGTTGVASSSSSAVTPAGYSSGGHDTPTSTLFQTVYSTVSLAYQSSSASAAGYGSGSGSSGSGEQCAQDVTVTSTEKVYVTVTAGQTPGSSESSPVETPSVKPTSTIHITHTVTPNSSAPAYTAPSSSSPAAPVSSSSSVPAYSAPSSSSETSPKSDSTPTAVPYSSSSSESSSSAYPILTAYTEAQKEVAATSTSSAPASYTSSASTSGGKRGLAYNSADLTTCFDGSDEITWAYNWVSASAGLTGLKFIPTLHDGSNTFTSVWNTEASASIASGSTTLFSFNEPDESSQANMSPSTAAEMYIKYMNPFAGKASLCAPSVTNGPASENMGLTWLQEFIDACDGKCHIDCYNIHWYASPDADGFKDHVTQAISMAGEKPVWVSEYGCTGASDDQVNSFLEEVMPWMDSNDSIAGYAYFMAADGTLITGTEPSTYGKTYMSYTG